MSQQFSIVALLCFCFFIGCSNSLRVRQQYNSNLKQIIATKLPLDYKSGKKMYCNKYSLSKPYFFMTSTMDQQCTQISRSICVKFHIMELMEKVDFKTLKNNRYGELKEELIAQSDFYHLICM